MISGETGKYFSAHLYFLKLFIIFYKNLFKQPKNLGLGRQLGIGLGVLVRRLVK
jgi:hypothetical protein